MRKLDGRPQITNKRQNILTTGTRIRKVKCDEAKPFCIRCTKTGRRCDGYLDAKSMAQRRRRSGVVHNNTISETQTPVTLFYEWASSDEKRSFHFFQHVTAPCLSADFDGAFWRVLVLQICQTEPAVKHAVLAVSSLHESMVRGTFAPYVDTGDRQSFALWQYNKAITCLLDQMREADAKPLVPLLTCVLFVCIEFMQGKDRESLIHLDQGRQILSQLGRKVTMRNPEVDVIKQHLVPMYTRLSLTLQMFGGDSVPIPPQLKLITDVPMMFESIDDVRYALYDFMEECLRFTKKFKFRNEEEDNMREFEEEQEYLLRKLSRFNVAFSLFQSTHGKYSAPGCMALIEIHLKTAFIWVSTALSVGQETVFDDHVTTFSAIIPLATAFMDAISSPPRETPNSRPGPSATSAIAAASDTRRFSAMFTFETHIIAPLYFVATKCRHPIIRRSALELLRRTPGRRENLWRADTMATLAEHTIKLEEKHLRPTSYENTFSPSASPPEMMAPFPYPYDAGDMWSNTMHDNPPFSCEEVAAAATVASSGSADVSADLGHLDLSQIPVDPSLLLDTREGGESVRRPHSGPSSVASSLDDMAQPTIYVSNSTSGPTSMPMAAPPSAAMVWASYSQHAPPGIILEPPTPLVEGQDHLWPIKSRRTSGGSVTSGGSYSSLGQGVRSADAPFDVPERFRVHNVIIPDDSRVMMFRKLGGLDGRWHIQTEFVSAH